MGKINLTINDKLEREFREMAYKVKGMKKGFLTDATEEAITVWLKSVRAEWKKESPWPEEEKALENIKTGKTEMVTQKREEFLHELKELENES
jgi:hypothetical protein